MITARIFAKKDYPAKDGSIPIYLRITINRKVLPPIALNKRTRPEHWDDATGRPNPDHPNYRLLYRYLDQLQRQADDIILQHEISGRQLTRESFGREFGGLSPYDFYYLVDKYVELKRLEGKSFEYLQKVRWVTKKLKDQHPVLNLHQVDYEFVSSYVAWLRNSRNNCQNTINSNVKIFRRIFRHGIKLKLIKENPWLEYRLTSVKSDRESLTIDELRKYEQLQHFDLPFYLKQILTWFLLAVATGRRFGDLQMFDQWQFSDEYVKIEQMKRVSGRENRKVVMMFLNNRIRTLVEEIREKNYKLPSNTNANKFMRTINSLAGVTKHITFHSARHTFASINLQLTENITVRRDLLGHDSVKSTQIYEHTDPMMLRVAMGKWDMI